MGLDWTDILAKPHVAQALVEVDVAVVQGDSQRKSMGDYERLFELFGANHCWGMPRKLKCVCDDISKQ